MRLSRSARRSLAALALVLGLLAAPLAAVALGVQEEILAQTEAIRGLAEKEPVPVEFVPPARLRETLLTAYEEEASVRELEISRKLLVMLGLLSPDADLYGMVFDLYAENIAGYYSRLDRKMYVVSGQESYGPIEKITLAHEFTHALQDQHFDLGKLQAATENNGDRSLALTALIEGDATLTMALYARRHLSAEELARLQSGGGESSIDRAPLVVRDEVLFPYTEGFLFVLRLWAEGGFEAVNAAFQRPPSSSEQIIHPEKYLASEEPIEVSLPDLPAVLGSGWTQLRTDVLGELDMRILLEQFSDPGAAARGAEGWAGDRFAFLENAAGQNALVLSTVWDDADEAGEFFNHFVGTVGRRYGARARRLDDAPSRILWSTPNGSQLLQKWGPRVVIIMAPDMQTTGALLAAIAPGAPAPAPSPGPVPAPVQLPR
jgi:hypothetical protein